MIHAAVVWENVFFQVYPKLSTLSAKTLLPRIDKSGVRKYIVKKFPYILIYRFKDDVIFITAVAHAARKPDYWESRLMG
ncbi:MAG: type II toxin-antitoxin system RelE/ParE family toxin [bacterium]|nr:type II toxin-antitoxin system RelE/ParE family toxin [bacterium]